MKVADFFTFHEYFARAVEKEKPPSMKRELEKLRNAVMHSDGVEEIKLEEEMEKPRGISHSFAEPASRNRKPTLLSPPKRAQSFSLLERFRPRMCKQLQEEKPIMEQVSQIDIDE